MTTLEQVFERLERLDRNGTTYLVIGWTNGEAIHEEYSPDEYFTADLDYENCKSDPMIDACAIIRVESDLYSYIEYTEF